ncbi:hypothetical protein KKE14_00560 [Patescibacteria group bacterium]|nr:hypothetical protein [Patescibacteria group bacterium]
MPKLNHLIALFLILGVVYAETLPNLSTANSSIAYSEEIIAPTQSEELLSLLQSVQGATVNEPYLNNVLFAGNLSTLPDNPGTILSEFSQTIIPNVLPALSPDELLYPLINSLPEIQPEPETIIPSSDQPYINDVIPQINTPLFMAYADGGYAWYAEDNKVVVRFLDNTFRSYDKYSGEQISWLQDRLAIEPISSPNALQNYLDNYRGRVIAETETWALVKFPSGGFLKIAKTSLKPDPFLTQE